jgi:beta-lactamase regulating signal transducer with metallopeptidase domain
MNALWQTITTSGPIRQLGWTLIHSLWLGTLIALAHAAAQPILRRRTANARYLAACAALLLFLAATAAAFVLTPIPATIATSSAIQSKQTITAAQSNITATAAATTSTDPLFSRAAHTLDPALPFLSIAWLAGVALIAAWQITAWRGVQRIKRAATPIVDTQTTQLLDNLAQLMNIRRAIPLLQSARINVPTLIGFVAPAILFPAGLITALSPDQLRAILAHELAHVRRHDYLVNLLQTIVQTLFFFHPAAWYISARIRFEREACCDDLVIHRAGADPAAYAQSLLTVARRPISANSAADLPATLALAAVAGPSDLRRRVQRLLNHEQNPARFAAAWPIPFLLIAAVTIALLHTRAPIAHAAEKPTASAPADAAKNDAAKNQKASTPNDLQIRLVAQPDDKSGEADEIPDPDHKDKPLRVLKPVLLDGRDIARAYQTTSAKIPAVGIDLTDQGGEKLKKITTDNINHRLAIIVNGQLLTAPTIRSTISKSLVITAGQKEFTPEKVQSLITTINNSRPAPGEKPKPD